MEQINQNEVLGYLGYKGGELPEGLLQDIGQMSQQVIIAASPKLTYRIFERRTDGSIPRLGFELKGEDVKKLLTQSYRVVLFGATLGAGVDAMMMRLQASDVGKAFLFDACANAAIEDVCDNFCADIMQKYGYVTDRFSPGYGDLPFSQQRDFAAALDFGRTIGVTLTESGLMVPQKSVSAVFGIADSVQPMRFRGCSHCNLFRTCTLRKENRTCGKF